MKWDDLLRWVDHRPSVQSERTADSFLEDIRRNPDDDTPRLIFADWLDENGDAARAEFIRLQCRLAQLAEDDPERAALERREEELLSAHEQVWTTGAFLRWLNHPAEECSNREPHRLCEAVAGLTRLRVERDDPTTTPERREEIERQDFDTWLSYYLIQDRDYEQPLFAVNLFRRGFIDEALIGRDMLMLFGPAMRDIGMIRRLTLRSSDVRAHPVEELFPFVRETFETPPLLSLDLGYGQIQRSPDLQVLLDWPGLRELTELRLCVWLPEGLWTLINADKLTNLRRLEVTTFGYTEDVLFAMLDSPTLANLERLTLRASEYNPPLSDAILARFRARFGCRPDEEFI
jgi:uncharacterized protein (TIGR02996 family)